MDTPRKSPWNKPQYWVPPEHKVTIQYHMDTRNFTVHCSVCGYLGTPKKTWAQAMNRKSTHDREQDAGAD